jgi:hypothetical protein
MSRSAQPTDTHLASTVHCVDGEIIEWLERREQRRRDETASAANKPQYQFVVGQFAIGKGHSVKRHVARRRSR